MSVLPRDPAAESRAGPRRPWQHPAFAGTLALGALAALGLALAWSGIAGTLTRLELASAALLPESWLRHAAWFVLPLLAFGAGVLASVSPCVLPLVPLNAAFIGASEASGWRAASLSARFVLGAALALSALGLVADLAGFVLVRQRGPVLLGSGLLMLYLGLAALELAPLPFAGHTAGAGRRLGPVAAGAAFSLVTTPCASPLVAGVLAAATAHQVPGFAALNMLSFALGYTLLVFLAGVFGGQIVQRLRPRSFAAPRAAAAAILLIAGVGFASAGIAWF